MSAMSDAIERFINEMLAESESREEDSVELKRNELAQYFGCAPSQINYVLTTRFSLDRGYVITSKRGGGGHITIVRLQAPEGDLLHQLASGGIGESLSMQRARAIAARLKQEKLLTGREAAMLLAACSDAPFVPSSVRDYVRANTMRAMIVAIMKNRTAPEGQTEPTTDETTDASKTSVKEEK